MFVEGRFPERTRAALRAAGYDVTVLPDWAELSVEGASPVTTGSAKMIGVDPATGVRSLLSAAGFTEVLTGYWNTVLFPLMALKRKLSRRREGNPSSDVVLMPAPVERLFAAIVRFESVLLGAGVRLPFGGSVLATAMRP